MYRELGPEDHQKMLGLGPDDLPELLILLGVFDVHRGAERFSRYLENATFSRSETSASGVPYYTGEHRGTRVALSGLPWLPPSVARWRRCSPTPGVAPV